ncbi:hypothetical protein M406DRAFT_37999 [Cryphonectria parasitica EP155]|uniref:General transcription and DNA repair factor IIH n=1 Tax=Cryphonectria parasitica (strain ATCC 38755 / EP155) TaxID=660469 RepID=A0A9P5CQI7_CRYP1|nr:uncharacterized protein M406DRAFT_37999 [Cryphonectria parasitica EP155]KAF3766100.1 hypothetical protein M406DRAFT_37999 [Cryphonectria parasitica EP155]
MNNYSDDDLDDHRVTSGADRDSGIDAPRHGGRSQPRSHGGGGGGGGRHGRDRRKNNRTRAAWEEGKFTWDVPEDEEGNVSLTALLEAEKRRRLLRDTTPLQRGIIRHLVLVLDMSFAMMEKDLLPNRFRLMMSYSVEFVREYFEQNPISQMGIVMMRQGLAKRVSEMSGNPAVLIDRLRELEKDKEPDGDPSLQNALEMCRGELFHAPSHGTREALIVYGALLSSDPGDIHDTINNLVSDRIRVSMVGLAAQVAICSELCSRTNGGNDSCYSVAKDEQHFRELLLEKTTPPATLQAEQSSASLLMMGFPSRTKADAISFCACHHKPCREGYLCTRCSTKVCRLPAECPACGLTLILSTHLARSYHHLFPLRNWVTVPWSEAHKSAACYACLTPFPQVKSKDKDKAKGKGKGKEKDDKAEKISESGRYACVVCHNHFCIDCDVFAHEVVHNCPGCQSDTRAAAKMQAEVQAVEAANGVTHANGEMIVD